jgi:hypothetical protein
MKLAMTLVFFMSIVLSFGQSGFSMSDMQRDLMLSTGNLLQNGEIKNELKLDREQSGKVNEILKEYRRRSNEISKPGRGNDLSAGLSSLKNISELNAETDKKVAEVLNVEQRRRFRQMQWQCMGYRALYEEDLQKELGLNEDQVGKLGEHKARGQERLMQAISGKSGAGMQSAVKKAREDAQKSAIEILTPDQQTSYKAALGKEVKAAKRYSEMLI